MLARQENCLAQLISLVENENPELPEMMERLRPHLGKAYCVGVTGPPGGGKSTVVDKLTATIRSKGLSVGIIAVDPSSPISGGAILGDRVRMARHCLDEGVFIRSMATRGSLGGLAKAVAYAVNLMDAFGMDIIIVETAGVGQTEMGIRQIADAVVLILAPGFGDDIQAMKAGLIEVADIIVVNKADRDGAERLLAELGGTLIFGRGRGKQLIVATQAINGTGIAELYQAIDQKRAESQHRSGFTGREPDSPRSVVPDEG